MSTSWTEISRKILAKLDIPAEYRALGLDITSTKPSAKGWLSCRAMGREDNSPSAAINVGDGELRGRYKDLGGNGESMSLWDFAAKYGNFPDWHAARRHYAQQTGFARNLPKNDEERPEDQLQWIPKPAHFPLIVKGFLAKYPGVTLEALELAGVRLANYPLRSPNPTMVLAFPVYGEQMLDGGPVGWVCQAVDGRDIPLWQGEGKPPRPVKRMTRGASGLLNRQAIAHWNAAKVVWKVEGVSDMLMMQALIPPDHIDEHIVVSNACGASEAYLPGQLAHLFAGKSVIVCHDRDQSGQDGAELWVSALLPVADEVRNFQLPFEYREHHGHDLRDLITQGRTCLTHKAAV